MGRLRPGPTSPGWPLLSARSVWLFWAGCVSSSGCWDCFAPSSPRSSISAQYEARGLPSLLCASTDTGRWRRWRPFASSSPRRQLQQQAQLRSKHVGFYNLCVRALARGGEYAGDRFASSSLRESTSAWDEARGLPVLCTSLGTRLEIRWRLIGIEPYLSRSTVWRPREIAEFSPSNRGRAQGAPATPPDGSWWRGSDDYLSDFRRADGSLWLF